MGAFYGSIQIRSEDVAGLRRILESAAAERGVCFLMAPPSNGWIGVYPSGHGQDVALSAAIAAALPGPVVHLLVHDDDVFAYMLYDAGGQIDEYCSDPDYFEPSPPSRWSETAGRPEALAALGGIADGAEFAKILERKKERVDPFRATWQMKRVAELLGLSNVETSYEYLRQGETRGIKGWRGFVHVPDLSAEKEAKRRRHAEVTATIKRFERDGILLVSRKRASPRLVFPPRPVCCAHPAGGFLLAWCDLGGTGDTEVEWWRSPWREPSEAGLRVGSKVHRLCASPRGRFLAVGYAAGEWSAEIFDLDDRRRLTTLQLARAADHISFTQDERSLVSRSQGEVRLLSTAEGYAVRSIPLGAGRSAAVHPDGRWLVADVQDGYSCGVAMVDLQSGAVGRVLSTAKHDLTAWMAAHAAGQPVTGFHPQEVPNKVEFTPDGRHLVVSVGEGVRVYSWEDLLRSGDSLPPPVASADSNLVQLEAGWHRNTYGFAVDPRRRLVFFPALDGSVHALDLETGKATTAIEVPGTPPVIEVTVSADGETLASVADPGMFARGAKRPASIWQVWNLLPVLADRTGHFA